MFGMKDFDSWNLLKKEIHNRNVKQTYHESEIWWASIGVNIGFEEDGKNNAYERPVLVLRKYGKELFFGIPLSTVQKEGIFYLNFQTELGMKYSVLLSQAKVFSSRRLLRKVSKLSRGKIKRIKYELSNLIKI